MARTETIVQFTEPLLEQLDRVAAQRGISRSQLIREAVEAHLNLAFEEAITAAIVEGYRRLPATEPELDWGDQRRRDAWDDLAW